MNTEERDKIKDLLKVLSEKLKKPENKDLLDEFVTDLSGSCSTGEQRIDDIYELCIERIIKEQATSFYKDFPIEAIRTQLVVDFIRMERARRRDDFEDFCMAVYQQIECMVNKIGNDSDLNAVAEKLFPYPAYSLDGSVSKRKEDSSWLVSHMIFGKGDYTKHKQSVASQYAMDKFKCILYFVCYRASPQNDDYRLFHSIGSDVEDIYNYRNKNHRGNEPTDKQNMITLTQQQSNIFTKIKNFFSNDSDIFVLKGYAGTGKTTLIGEICCFLRECQLSYSVLAPTGRASKVLREKVGDGKTIHSEIFSNELQCVIPEDGDDSKKSYHYLFPLITSTGDKHTIIVDESSMISDMVQSNDFLQFGSGKLLSDLLEYFKTTGCRKLIFVGDDAQLPPVGDNHSRALDTEELQNRGFRVESAELIEVVRQKADSLVLQEAMKVRTLLQKPLKERTVLELKQNRTDIIEISPLNKTKEYVTLYPQPELGNGVIIHYSNSACFDANRQIRELMYGTDVDLQVGDVLLINNNNYRTFGREIYNGDMAKVTNVGNIECRSVPVTIDGKKKYVELKYRDVELLFPKENGHQIVPCKILMNLLESKERDISIWEMRALYIDFCIRHPKLREGSSEFKETLIHDLYFNSLKVKYGYAITCHKAQGGEWDTVFVDYSGRNGLSDDALRWCYTATTRAKHILYTINAPHITSFTGLNFKPIAKISKSPSFFFHEDVDLYVEGMSRTALIGTRLKCKGFLEDLKDTPYELINVQPFQYQDRYTVRVNDGEEKQIILTAFYDGNGIYKLLPTDNGDENKDTLSSIFNKAIYRDWSFTYCPSSKVYEDLYQRMLCECDSVGIMITNIVEEKEKCFVTYNIIADARYACIQFYVSNGRLSTAMPRSENGESDNKLQQLINKLQ